MELIYFIRAKKYAIIDGSKTVRINGRVFYDDCSDLLTSFLSDEFKEIEDIFRNLESIDFDIIGIFKESDDLTEKFPEYLI